MNTLFTQLMCLYHSCRDSYSSEQPYSVFICRKKSQLPGFECAEKFACAKKSLRSKTPLGQIMYPKIFRYQLTCFLCEDVRYFEDISRQ